VVELFFRRARRASGLAEEAAKDNPARPGPLRGVPKRKLGSSEVGGRAKTLEKNLGHPVRAMIC